MPQQKVIKDYIWRQLPENMAKEIVQINSGKDQEKKKLNESWSQLPPELLQLVSAHLFCGDYTTFRAICKSWRSSSLISRPLLPLLDSPHSQTPCLMSVGNYKCRIFHPIYNNAYHMDIPELLNATIHYSEYGWLLLSRDDCSIFFFHPFNKIKIELPSCLPFETMCFSSPPTSTNCFVIGFTFAAIEVALIRRGEVDWTIRRVKGFSVLSGCNPVLYKGKCYCLFMSGDVGVFDLNEYLREPNQHSLHWILFSTGLPQHLRDSHERSYLMKANGKLLAVFEVHDCQQCVYVFSLNFFTTRTRMIWHKVCNLGNKILYTSLKGSFSESTVVKGMDNKIYLPNVLENQGNSNVFYSLKTNKYHSFFSDYSTKISSHGKVLNNSAWIIPMLTTMDRELNW